MTVFITGGCKNGKSTFALGQALALAGEGPRYYVATMAPCDDHERECVRRHRAARAGMGFVTLEQPRRLTEVLARVDRRGTFLLDSVTALLANEMFAGGFDSDAPARTAGGLATFLDGVKNCVVVSDYIYADGARYDPRSEAFRRGLAALDRLLAERCGCVVEVCAGLPIVQKGRLPGADKK